MRAPSSPRRQARQEMQFSFVFLGALGVLACLALKFSSELPARRSRQLHHPIDDWIWCRTSRSQFPSLNCAAQLRGISKVGRIWAVLGRRPPDPSKSTVEQRKIAKERDESSPSSINARATVLSAAARSAFAANLIGGGESAKFVFVRGVFTRGAHTERLTRRAAPILALAQHNGVKSVDVGLADLVGLLHPNWKPVIGEHRAIVGGLVPMGKMRPSKLMSPTCALFRIRPGAMKN